MTNQGSAVAIVTGASEGIGRALALHLAGSGEYPNIVLAARNADRLEALRDECQSAGATAAVIATDVADDASCQQLIDQTVARFGRIDTLFNNAGVTMWARFEEIENLDVFRQVMDVNYFGAVYCTRYALPHLRQSGGRLVAVASIAGITGVPTRSGYAASKHAMIGFFDSLRIEIADSGVSVTVVCPDFVVSEIHKRAMQGDGSALGKSPMQKDKIMTAERCAELVATAARDRRRIVITSTRGKFGRLLKIIAPGVIDRIAARAIESGS